MKKNIVEPTEEEVKLFGGKKELVKPKGTVGSLFGIDIVTSNLVPDGEIHVINKPDFVGSIPVRQEIQVTPRDPIKSLSLDWKSCEVIGVGTYNSRCFTSVVPEKKWYEEIEEILKEGPDDERRTSEKA